MSVINIVNSRLRKRMSKIKLLAYSVVFVHILCILHLQVELTSVQVVGDGITQVLHLVYPGEGSTTELKTW